MRAAEFVEHRRIEKLGSAVTGFSEGQDVIGGVICPKLNSCDSG